MSSPALGGGRTGGGSTRGRRDRHEVLEVEGKMMAALHRARAQEHELLELRTCFEGILEEESRLAHRLEGENAALEQGMVTLKGAVLAASESADKHVAGLRSLARVRAILEKKIDAIQHRIHYMYAARMARRAAEIDRDYKAAIAAESRKPEPHLFFWQRHEKPVDIVP